MEEGRGILAAQAGSEESRQRAAEGGSADSRRDPARRMRCGIPLPRMGSVCRMMNAMKVCEQINSEKRVWPCLSWVQKLIAEERAAPTPDLDRIAHLQAG